MRRAGGKVKDLQSESQGTTSCPTTSDIMYKILLKINLETDNQDKIQPNNQTF